MDLALGGSLVGLALIDSTSFGTLLIPIWLLLNPGRIRPVRMLIYLATIGVFYWAVGLIIALGAGQFAEPISRMLQTRAAGVVQLVVGIALLVLSFRMDSKKARARRAARPGGGRIGRWRERALGDTAAAPLGLVGLALGAASLEVATMLPYLAALGLITTAGMTTTGTTLTLAGYCLIMITPALVLLLIRLIARRAVEPSLQRLSAWMTKHAASTTAWVVGIVGFLLARDAGARVGLFSWIDSLS